MSNNIILNVCTYGARLNMRESPSANAKILTQLTHAEKVSLIHKRADGWAFVELANGKTGWVQERFLIPENGSAR